MCVRGLLLALPCFSANPIIISKLLLVLLPLPKATYTPRSTQQDVDYILETSEPWAGGNVWSVCAQWGQASGQSILGDSRSQGFGVASTVMPCLAQKSLQAETWTVCTISVDVQKYSDVMCALLIYIFLWLSVGCPLCSFPAQCASALQLLYARPTSSCSPHAIKEYLNASVTSGDVSSSLHIPLCPFSH